MPGCLYVVATPLGNLEDISPRALTCLRDVAVVFAEDTRRSGALLQHFGIAKPLRSLHAHNEQSRMQAVLGALAQGDDVALLSDAGTPAVSDPGADAVQAAHEAGYRVCPIVGPSALAAALSVAGFAPGTEGTLFLGFLPTKNKERREALARVAAHRGLVVLYEGPHRVAQTCHDLAALDQTRPLCLCRELTKMHEEVLRLSAADAAAWADQSPPRGEFTLVLGPLTLPAPTADEADLDGPLQRCLDAGLTPRDAATAVAAVLQVGRREAYRRCLVLAGRVPPD